MTILPLVAAAAVLLTTPIAPLVQGDPGRLRPPESVTCPRNDLTVYAGRVTKMERLKSEISLTIVTDSKTTERVTIRHPDTADPDASFLFKGKPFARTDWDVIAPKGTLGEGIRANAWVCRDGRVIVDFASQPSSRF
jgi:hypothetical protein